MYARVFPQGEAVPRELARMGGAAPPLAQVWKLIAVPQATAAVFTAWLAQQGGWWCSAPGAHPDTVDVLFGGSTALPGTLGQAAAAQPALQPVATALEAALALLQEPPRTLQLGSATLDLSRPRLMGILNVTPDSFSDGGLYLRPEEALKHAEAMLSAGADLIDVGGQSSRPGAVPVPAEVEWQRVVPVVREIVKRFGALVSVDTYRARVAEAALDAGAVMVNDISALRFDPKMAPLLARHQAAVVLMHMQGTPRTMQQAPTYHHVVDDVYGFLAARLRYAMAQGIDRQRIVLDPGFGFGKRGAHNLDLLRDLAHFRSLGQPLLVGTSRKLLLARYLPPAARDRLEDTLVSVLYAALQGAALVRVHDVAPVQRLLALLDVMARHGP
ncbi:MAG: dihydropteroate synthase [Candidatus Tectimicrobiota bacterium]|nr:MAG: dihydropteroate synthase [Candidatus Tectomicrobia bacterium]